MGWRDRDEDDHDDFRDVRRRRRRKREKGNAVLGVISVSVAVLATIMIGGVFLVAVIMAAREQGPIDDRDPRAIVIGAGAICSLLLAVTGAVLGIVGLFLSNHTGMICSILGLVFSSLLVMGIMGLMCLGALA